MAGPVQHFWSTSRSRFGLSEFDRLRLWLAFILDGRGDIVGAERLWWRAAEAGLPAAMNNLATNVGAHNDHGAADEWWHKAAEVGDTDAMDNLGVRSIGRGAYEQARCWWRKAAASGDAESASALEIGRSLKAEGVAIEDDTTT